MGPARDPLKGLFPVRREDPRRAAVTRGYRSPACYLDRGYTAVAVSCLHWASPEFTRLHPRSSSSPFVGRAKPRTAMHQKILA